MNKSYLIYLAAYFFVLSACGTGNGKQEALDSLSNEAARTFSVGNYHFAIKENRKFIKYNKGIYQRGDEVYIVLEDVGPFALNADSLNHAEMKLEVTDAIGQVVTVRDSLFGPAGHKKFENNMLRSPNASYSSDLKDQPGKYSLRVVIYDLVRKDSIEISDDFKLE